MHGMVGLNCPGPGQMMHPRHPMSYPAPPRPHMHQQQFHPGVQGQLNPPRGHFVPSLEPNVNQPPRGGSYPAPIAPRGYGGPAGPHQMPPPRAQRMRMPLPEEQGIRMPHTGDQGMAMPPPREMGMRMPPHGEQGLRMPHPRDQESRMPPEDQEMSFMPPEQLPATQLASDSEVVSLMSKEFTTKGNMASLAQRPPDAAGMPHSQHLPPLGDASSLPLKPLLSEEKSGPSVDPSADQLMFTGQVESKEEDKVEDEDMSLDETEEEEEENLIASNQMDELSKLVGSHEVELLKDIGLPDGIQKSTQIERSPTGICVEIINKNVIIDLTTCH